MKLKGRSILVILLLIFGGYAYYDHMQDKKTEAKKLEQSHLLQIDFEQVDSFEIDKDGQKIALKRSVDGWDVKEPLKDLADNSAAEDFVKNIATENIIDVANEGPKIDWTIYGLDRPLGKITLKTTSGKSDTFEISGKKNFEDNSFLRRNGENRILVVNSVWVGRVNKTVLDFQDRRFLRHKMASIDRFTLKNQNGLLELILKDGKWAAPSKKDLVLDQNKVRDLLREIADAKAAEYVNGKMPTTHFLLSLELKLADKIWKAEVSQAPAPDFKIYAKVSEPAFQMKMEPGALDKLIDLHLDDLKETPPAKEGKPAAATSAKEVNAILKSQSDLDKKENK